MLFKHVNTPDFQELSARMKRGQRWYTTPDGIEYPSVTTILGAEEKSGIKAWKEAMGPKRAKKEQQRAADRGTAVHKMIEDYVNNIEYDDVIAEHDYQNVKLFNQMRPRLKKIDNVRIQEVPLYSDTLKIAGRVDCVAEYDGTLSIIDFKTSNNNKGLDMVEDYFLQCTAYAIMYSELFDEAIEDIVVLIGVEKGIAPMMYRKKIDDYIEPLLKRIHKFYKLNKGK